MLDARLRGKSSPRRPGKRYGLREVLVAEISQEGTRLAHSLAWIRPLGTGDWQRPTSLLRTTQGLSLRGHSLLNWLEPTVNLLESNLALQAMAFLAVPDPPLQRRQEIKGDIRRLEVPRVGVGHVMGQ